jgi:hypothetical protein
MNFESSTAVAELQGLYGPFSFGEKLLQKIWLRGDFDRGGARLGDGRVVRIRHPGKWNLLGGPDFKGARLTFGDAREIIGDVELHLRVEDWAAHGHATDPAYDGVVLHVVLFPPDCEHVTKGVGGKAIPVLALLPLLHHDLEEFAAEEAVELLAGSAHARIPEELALLGPEKLWDLLRSHAQRRWERKVHFARLRSQRLGWAEACHQTALEILGYRFNRAPMLRVAGRWPLVEWAREGAIEADALYLGEGDGWSVQGVRPANHPRARLRQYAAWVRARPDWPSRAAELAPLIPVPEPDAETRTVRRQCGFGGVRELIAHAVCGEAVGGTRLDNLICDGLLPLLATRSTANVGSGLWFHWFPGDQPPHLMSTLRQLGISDGRAQPACHGFAQGLFGWIIERETSG